MEAAEKDEAHLMQLKKLIEQKKFTMTILKEIDRKEMALKGIAF